MERDPAIPFTYEYSQPEEYHFSIDSIEMPWEIALSLRQRTSDGEISAAQLRKWEVLDLCAGCGVLGFELNFHLPEIRHIDFVEVQEVYQSHFEHNKNLALKKSSLEPKGLRLVRDEVSTVGEKSAPPEFQFYTVNYDQWPQVSGGKKYDLILCNPPYFFPEQGKLSPSQFKNRCRFFMDSSFKNLIDVIHESLAERGEAYLLLRDLEDHGIDLLTEIRHLSQGRMKIENLTMIRGTFLLKLYRQ